MSAAKELDGILAVIARRGLDASEVKLADGTHLMLVPRERPVKEDKNAPKELPDNFEELPVPDWIDPTEKKDTPEHRKRTEDAIDKAFKEAIGESIPKPDE